MKRLKDWQYELMQDQKGLYVLGDQVHIATLKEIDPDIGLTLILLAEDNEDLNTDIYAVCVHLRENNPYEHIPMELMIHYFEYIQDCFLKFKPVDLQVLKDALKDALETLRGKEYTLNQGPTSEMCAFNQ